MVKSIATHRHSWSQTCVRDTLWRFAVSGMFLCRISDHKESAWKKLPDAKVEKNKAAPTEIMVPHYFSLWVRRNQISAEKVFMFVGKTEGHRSQWCAECKCLTIHFVADRIRNHIFLVVESSLCEKKAAAKWKNKLNKVKNPKAKAKAKQSRSRSRRSRSRRVQWCSNFEQRHNRGIIIHNLLCLCLWISESKFIYLFAKVYCKGKGAQAKPKKGKKKTNSNVQSSTVTVCRVDHLLTVTLLYYQ